LILAAYPAPFKDEIRRNLLRAIEKGDALFPACMAMRTLSVRKSSTPCSPDTISFFSVWRGQAKSRISPRLDQPIGSGDSRRCWLEITGDPLNPSARLREKSAADGDNTPLSWMPRENRFVEKKLATPDVTMADIIGDVDPIRAARGGRDLSDELTIHYGLLRAPIAASLPSMSSPTLRKNPGRPLQHHAGRRHSD